MHSLNNTLLEIINEAQYKQAAHACFSTDAGGGGMFHIFFQAQK